MKLDVVTMNMYNNIYASYGLIEGRIQRFKNPFKVAGDAIDTVMNFFKNIGSWCVDIVNATLDVFDSFVSSGLKILTLGTESSEFDSFWVGARSLINIFNTFAITLMVLLFMYNLCTDAWDSRHEVELWGFMKMFAKLGVGVVLVANSVTVVTAILNMGAILANALFKSGNVADGLKMTQETETMIRNGISGLEGFLQGIVFLMAGIVAIICAVVIVIEIYQRVFKMFVLIPFSVLTFTTVVMGDNNGGNQVFRNYLMSVIKLASEAIIIMMFINITYSLIENPASMQSFFPKADNLSQVTIECPGEEALFYAAIADGDMKVDIKELKKHRDSFSDASKAIIDDIIAGKEMKYSSIYIDGEKVRSNFIDTLLDLDADKNWLTDKHTVILYEKCNWGMVFSLILRIFFPIILCAGLVKGAGHTSDMIFR